MGRRAVVTGCSSGIGAAIAVALATAGADVAGLHLGGEEERAGDRRRIAAGAKR